MNDEVLELIDEANYLLDAQKKLLRKDIEENITGAISDKRAEILSFLNYALDIKESDLSAEDMNKVDNWLRE